MMNTYWMKKIKETAVMNWSRGKHRMNKREVVLDKFLLEYLTEEVPHGYGRSGGEMRLNYENVRTKAELTWSHRDRNQFENDYMLSRLVDFLEMKHYGSFITRLAHKMY
jgi:hypothetical protein